MIDKAVFWNIKSVNTQDAIGRLIDMNRRCHYSFIALMEPFRASEELDHYRSRIGFDHALVNVFKKIWIFWKDDWLEL